MTAKTLRKEGGTDCIENERGAGCREAKRLALVKIRTLMTSGGSICKKPGSNGQKPVGYNSKLNRAIRRILKYHACKKALRDAMRKQSEAEEEHYGRIPDPVVHTTFKETKFGDLITTSRDFPCSIVSIALFDGDTMLFACSGIPLPRGRSKLEMTRYLTSARLATEYKNKQYRDDKLKIIVCFPNGRKKGGLLELCNHHIAIVTLLDRQASHPLGMELQPEYPSEGDEMLSVGRAFESGCLMDAKVKLAPLCEGQFDEVRLDPPNSHELVSLWKPVSGDEGRPLAVLGGPVLGKDNRIIGMSIDVDKNGAYVSLILLKHLIRYLEYFQILIPKEPHDDNSCPKDFYTVIPSAFVSKIYRLKHLGYPMPPPLMLEFNGELLNRFEDFFWRRTYMERVSFWFTRSSC